MKNSEFDICKRPLLANPVMSIEVCLPILPQLHSHMMHVPSNPTIYNYPETNWAFVTPYCLLGQVLFLGLQFQFGRSKAAAHVAVRSSVLDTVNPDNKFSRFKGRKSSPPLVRLSVALTRHWQFKS